MSTGEMDANERHHFRTLARTQLWDRYGDGLNLFAEDVREDLLLAEAAKLVLTQISADFRPAQQLLRACL